MDPATIAVLVMTAVALGALVWLQIHSRGTGGTPDEPQERPADEHEAKPPVQEPQHQKRRKRR